MHDEADFLRKLLENPAEDTVRLAYADWLDERGGEEGRAKAQFLRVTVHLTGPIRRVGWRKPRQNELQQLAARLPTDWLAVVSRLKVQGCPAEAEKQSQQPQARSASVETLFAFVCDKRWDEMTATEYTTVRRCEQCQTNVHYCDTLAVARDHADKGHCIAVDLGIIRRSGDLSRNIFWTGQPSAQDIRESEERELDVVSREREERKRQQNREGE